MQEYRNKKEEELEAESNAVETREEMKLVKRENITREVAERERDREMC